MNKLEDLGNRTTELGHKITRGISIPVGLVLLGAVTLPLGLIAWFIAAVLFFGTWFGDKKA